jgi:hypothetical protein
MPSVAAEREQNTNESGNEIERSRNRDDRPSSMGACTAPIPLGPNLELVPRALRALRALRTLRAPVLGAGARRSRPSAGVHRPSAASQRQWRSRQRSSAGAA